MGSRHVLPFQLQKGWITVTGPGHTHDADEKPFTLALGRHDRHVASLTRDDLTDLHRRLGEALDAAPRLLLTNPREGDLLADEWLHARISEVAADGHGLEVAVLVDHTHLPVAVRAGELGATMLVYPTLDAMLADGGTEVLLLAGEGALEIATAAHAAQITVRLYRPAARQPEATR